MAVPLSGIICTIGPASQRADVLLELIRAGMSVVRMNFSHGSHEYHCKTIQEARKAIAMYQDETGLPKAVALALDTKGPEIRTGKLADGGDTAVIKLNPGDKITLSTNKELESKTTKEKIYVDYQGLPKIVKPGNRVFIDDGLIALVVKETKGDEVICEVENGGSLGSHKGVNLPGIAVDLPAVTERDKKDLKFGAEQQVDMVFASFIRDAKALTDIRQALGPAGERIKVISKIENLQGLANIDDIIHASDGVMVARGDLGIEIPTEDVPLAQKAIIAKCNKVGKPVIVATQMLDSMTTKPRPSRAEAADVANAIFDGADAVMLSGETAKGKYPAECVRVMARICAKVETVLWYENLQNTLKREIRTSGADHISAVTTAIAEAATVGQARAIVVASPCSMVAQMVSHMRPPCPIVMLTGCPTDASQTVLFRGIYPLLVEEMVIGITDFQKVIKSGLKLMTKMDLIEPGQKGSVVLVNAMSADKITFRLFTIQQQTREEREQEERCRRLALEQRCKEKAEKNACQKLKEAEDCRKKLEADKCKERAEKEACQKLKEAEDCRKNLEADKCKEKAQKEACQMLKEAEACRKRLQAESCNKKAEKSACQKLKEAQDCRKLLEAEKCKAMKKPPEAECSQKQEEQPLTIASCKQSEKNAEESKCKELQQKQQAEKCKEMAEKAKCKEMAEKAKCKEMAEKAKCKAAKEKEKEQAQLKIIEEETAKLMAAEKAKRAEEEAKKKVELEKCKQLSEEKKKKEVAAECKRQEEKKERADMAKRWKEVGAEREKKKEAELCKKLIEEHKKSKKELADVLLKAVCKKLKERSTDNCSKDKKK